MMNRILYIFSFTALCITIAISCGEVKKQIDPEDLKKFKKEHSKNQVLSQYYRWFLVFEKDQNEQRIKNHMKILSDSVFINTSGGAMKGKKGMEGFLNFVSEWKNAHHILATEVQQNEDGSLNLEAEIVYQNMLPDGARNNNKLHYSTILESKSNALPVFTSLELLPTEELESMAFRDAYSDNRAKSFIHYWGHLMDNLEGSEAKFKELLATNLDLQFPSRTIRSHEEFDSWIQETKSQLATSLHTPKNIEVTQQDDGSLKVSFDFDWKGITRNGDKLVAEFHHKWILENNLDEAYARIKDIKIEQRKPIQPVQEFEY